MRKTYRLIWISALCLGIFCCVQGFSALAAKKDAPRAAYPSFNFMHSSSVLNSPLTLVFPYESFTHAVCRKPDFLFWSNSSFNQYYFHRAELVVPSNPANFTRVSENILFQSGNSYLVIPQTLTLRLNNNFQPIPNPTLNLHKPD